MTREIIRGALVVVALTVAGSTVKAQQPVRVPTSVLQRYEGEWVYPDGNSVMIRLDGETLYRVIPNQKMPLVPMSQTLFRVGPNFTAEFILDEKGGATQILSSGS